MKFVPASTLLGELFESKCPKCGNVDRLTQEETERKVHCQRCYYHYDYQKREQEGMIQ